MNMEERIARINALYHKARPGQTDILPVKALDLSAESSHSLHKSPAALPGVNASSQEGCLAVNGMSYSGRDGENANSAVIVTVTPEDFVLPRSLLLPRRDTDPAPGTESSHPGEFSPGKKCGIPPTFYEYGGEDRAH